ncbi:hypothetical protein Tco_1346073 [Tanacetum coccineum]
METKDTLSSCSNSEEQQMQQMLKQAKILKGGCLNGLSTLKSNFTRILEQGITKSEFERAFSHIFGEDVDTFTRTFSQNMDTLEQQLTKETILESNCQNAFRVLKTQFEKIFSSVLIKPSSLDEKGWMTKMSQIQECTVQEVKALDAISEDKAKQSCMWDIIKSARYKAADQGMKHYDDDADIKPIYDEETMAGGLAPPRQMTSDHNSSELGIHDHSNELSRSKLVPKVVPLADKTAKIHGRMPTKIELTLEQSQQGVSNDVLSPTHYLVNARNYPRSYALSWKPCQGDSLNLPDHRIHKDGDGDASFQLKSDLLPHAHAQLQDISISIKILRIMKAQELKTKTSAQTLILKKILRNQASGEIVRQ